MTNKYATVASLWGEFRSSYGAHWTIEQAESGKVLFYAGALGAITGIINTRDLPEEEVKSGLRQMYTDCLDELKK